jgi:Flp pilus assembly protein TadD
VAACAFLAFSPALHAGFVWDDGLLFTSNANFRGFDPARLRWMFTNTRAAIWMPLTWITHGLDYVLFGMDPSAWHRTNLVLHAIVAVLFARLALRILEIAHAETALAHPVAVRVAAAAAALVFAVHPLRTESVAWITERRDLVNALFLVPATLAWLAAARGDGPASRRPGAYAISIVLFAASLLAKPSSMTFVLVLVVLDVYPLRRRPVRVVEKLPFLALGLASAAVAWWGQATMGRTVRGLEEFGPAARLAEAAYGLAFYARKTVWPARLAALYELPWRLDPLAARFVASAVAVLVAFAAIVLLRRRLPSVAAAAAAYVALLLPTLGLAHAGPQIAADRYSYLSCLPLALLAGGALFLAWTARPNVRRAAGAAALAWIVALFALARRQAATWRDEPTLWSHAIAVGHPSSVAHVELGVIEAEANRDAAGAEHFRAALDLRPDNGQAWMNLGHLDAKAGQLGRAEDDYRQACRAMSPAWPAYLALARLYGALRSEPERAVEPLRLAVASTEHEGRENFSPVPHLELGALLQQLGRRDEARPFLETAARYPQTRDEALRRLAR